MKVTICFVFAVMTLLPYCSISMAQVEVWDPIEEPIIDVDEILNCDRCVRPGDSVSCKDLHDLPTTNCTSQVPATPNSGPNAGTLGCFDDGPFAWVSNFWLRRTRPVKAGESGQECTTFPGKYCAKMTECKMVVRRIAFDSTGAPVFNRWCENDNNKVVDRIPEFEHVPSGADCEIPLIDPDIGDVEENDIFN